MAWVLVRYNFTGKRVVDALVDLPFALPTAVAGIALTAIYAQNGWIGQVLPFKVSYTPLGVWVALVFIGLPFVVRTLQPVLEDVNRELEEAAATLGANRWQTFSRVIFPILMPALLTGFALAFARALGEYGSVIFIAGNMPHGERDHAAADHHQARAVRLRRGHGHRGGDAGGGRSCAAAHRSTCCRPGRAQEARAIEQRGLAGTLTLATLPQAGEQGGHHWHCALPPARQGGGEGVRPDAAPGAQRHHRAAPGCAGR